MAMSMVMHGLREARTDLRLTQRELAKRAGVAYNTVFYAERGNPISYKSIDRINLALKVARIERDREQSPGVGRLDHTELSGRGNG